MHELNFYSRLFQSALSFVKSHLYRLSGTNAIHNYTHVNDAYVISNYTSNDFVIVPCAYKIY